MGMTAKNIIIQKKEFYQVRGEHTDASYPSFSWLEAGPAPLIFTQVYMMLLTYPKCDIPSLCYPLFVMFNGHNTTIEQKAQMRISVVLSAVNCSQTRVP